MLLAYSLTFSSTILVVVLLFSESVRRFIADWFFNSKIRPWFLPASIISLYCIITITEHAWRLNDFLIIAFYFILPIFFIRWIIPYFDSTTKSKSKAGIFDVVLILFIWFPIEFEFVPMRWITIDKLAYPLGIFVIVFYVLIILTGWRKLELFCPGDLSLSTFIYVGIAYLILALFILPLGIAISFIRPAFNSAFINNPESIIFLFLGIFFAVAIPEELLFRGWIQNLLMTRLKFLPALAISAIIFGLSHVDDKVTTLTRVFDVPNWWYGLFGAFAGLGYGYVYQKWKSIFASALLHTLVDFTWVIFFAG